MSTANSNFDNDPFPVFTPRSSLQQQLATRSPMQQQQQQIQQQQSSVNSNLIQQSPYSSSSGTNRFNSNQAGGGNMRSPSIQKNPYQQQQQQQQQQHDSSAVNRQLLATMVQNIALNQQSSTQTGGLNAPQTPLINKLRTPSSTPPPPNQQTPSNNQQSLLNQNVNLQLSASSNSLNHIQSSSSSQHHSNAHRKLFTSSMDTTTNHHMSNNDMVMLQQQNNNGGTQLDGGLHSFTPAHLSQNNLNSHQMISQNQQQFQQTDLEPSRMAPKDLSNIAHLKRSESYFMSDELRSELIRKNLVSMAVTSQDIVVQLPSQIKDYQNLVPLDNQQMNIEHKSRTYSYQTISYKATHIKNNCSYYLKRIMGFRYLNQRCAEIVEMWKKIQHANICTLRDVFGTKEFNGEHSIVFVYDYYPGLETLQYRLYNNPNINLKGWANPYNLDGAARPFSAGKTINGSRSLGLLPEQSVWEFVIQLTSIIRSIHSANLACRIVTPSRILVDHKSRLRLSGVGIFDVLDQENSATSIAQYQQEDLVEFGRLVLALACNSLIAIQKEHINTSVEIINRNYSNDLRNLISHFMTAPSNANGRVKNINDAMPIIGARFYTIIDNAYTRGDIIENDLSKEIENGRLFRLITKMNIVLERQEFNGDVQWSETGDRYMLKLFRDYVFHQVTPNGQPWIDLSHIVQCLNKFDTGSSDKICLVSPDSQNIMIVSYAQLKKCFEKVFNEITAAMNT